MVDSKLSNIVYKLPDDIRSKINSTSIETSSVSTQDFTEKDQRESEILIILEEYELVNCRQKLIEPVSSKDCEGYIYAYYSNYKPGIFKVGRSKDLPSRRIMAQEKNNNEKYRNKESFHCCFHHLIEACIHLELKKLRLKLEKKQDGYTE